MRYLSPWVCRGGSRDDAAQTDDSEKTFDRLELPFTIQAELGTGDGSIVIELAQKTFAEEENAAIEDYCARFVTAMALLQTAELYGGQS